MAEIPGREVVFPNWATIKENLAAQVAKVEAPTVGRASVSAQNITGVPEDLQSSLMDIVGVDFPDSLWDDNNVGVLNGNEYPEQITASVPSGKSLTINAGQRWLNVTEQANNGLPAFGTELPDDAIFVDVEAGGTLNLNADFTANSALAQNLINPNGEIQSYQLGGKNVAVINGSGTVNMDMGAYAANAFVSANIANVKMGEGNGVDGKNYYSAKGDSQGHDVEGGQKADTFQYDFENQNRVIGSNVFDGKVGANGSSGVDNIQLANLPLGTKVEVTVNQVGNSGTFPDCDMDITIKKPDGTELGEISAKDMNYLFTINGASSEGVSPASIGAGNSRTITIGD